MGRVLTRFSFDTENIDSVVFLKVYPAIVTISWAMGAFVMCIVALWPWLWVTLVPGAILSVWLLQIARKSVREIQRIDNMTRSPIATLVGEAVQGREAVGGGGGAGGGGGGGEAIATLVGGEAVQGIVI